MAWGGWDFGYSGVLRKVSKIDYENHKVYFRQPQKTGKNAKLVFYNILEELRYPGDYYIDYDTKILYFYPFDKINSKSEIILSNFTDDIIRSRYITDIVIKDISIECTPTTAINLFLCRQVLIDNCEIFNIGNIGILMTGNDNMIRNCKIHHVLNKAIFIYDAGNRKTLQHSNVSILNTEVYWYCNMNRNGFTPALRIEGVGIVVSHCYIHHGAGHGIYYIGNNLLFEYNEFSDIFESPYPTSAIYAAQDYTTRNNTVRYNYIHALVPNNEIHQGVFMDDVESGTIVTHNILVNAGRSIWLGGGRDYYARNNIIVNATYAMWIDARGITNADYFQPILKRQFYNIRNDPKVKGNLPPYITTYPNLSVIDNYYKNDTVEVPLIPPSAYVFDNCYIYPSNSALFMPVEKYNKTFLYSEVFVNNYINATEKDFADFKKGDYSIKKGSRLNKLGMDPVDMSQMRLPKKKSKNVVVPIIVTLIVLIVIGVIIVLIYLKIKRDKEAERSTVEKKIVV
ncbi:hypothetical protein TVAG_266320 [Trichomonas vaginalis G3]|uniref:Right handed beta helix domain-containing protein n=1 Tax=Trichomonas vaginalis (strain ATCC PRA-98 / G3) TaxID=412133 RepID=A2DQI5_TRIV3|nr:secreted protein-related family [Trichomonas vaginalis G3]EAY17269.1 hypothetical protein TVAG_266320 [Trichomonas vaginalis G3]KAI5523261.1 secreted protein-related family [Trichomonas vaginalis G3]|eukprot:XP_001329492.1 hypothetical protein [Trichomonas vaginalis G3]